MPSKSLLYIHFDHSAERFSKYIVCLCFQVAIEVEQEEGEGGTVGETFTDYVSAML